MGMQGITELFHPWAMKELPNYFTLGPGKVFIGWHRRQKVFEKIQGIRHLVLAEYGLH